MIPENTHVSSPRQEWNQPFPGTFRGPAQETGCWEPSEVVHIDFSSHQPALYNTDNPVRVWHTAWNPDQDSAFQDGFSGREDSTHSAFPEECANGRATTSNVDERYQDGFATRLH